mmetsp:Transcript_32844/g.38095  ORF Transcript_32844/g.38095 Transcript_32844/m.38095 type:complete len:458 (-) Transcript_32844:400-1773(-)
MPTKTSRVEAAPSPAKVAKKEVPSAGEEHVTSLKYMNGFGGFFTTEALKGALPEVGNTPQKCSYGLYAEQINGTSFTKSKHSNLRTWWYRIRPSAPHTKFVKFTGAPSSVPTIANPERIRWNPKPMPTEPTDFVHGLHCYCGAGDPAAKGGIRIYVYSCNKNMVNTSFSSADGDFLIVPQEGTLHITTESGKMDVPSGFIAVIPRGIRFSVDVPSTGARGYVAEAFDQHFELPPRGVIGCNGLANERDFETPVAWYEDRDVAFTCFTKYCDEMFTFEQDHSPFDVVAWHGNYTPYRYDLAKFCVINTVSFDHLDPSIFCVLTSQTAEPGVASCDFVIFPPRWMVAEHTFRPPYYHKNCMSEFMGNIRGVYEAKEKGFLPGGASLHSHMVAHGPEAAVFEKSSNAELKSMPPNQDHLAFMFESYYTFKLTDYGTTNHDEDYPECWSGIKKHFVNPTTQ